MKSNIRDLILVELKTIQENDPEKLLRPASVVDAARDPSTALHGRFNWDDEAAAHLQRLSTARMLIQSYVVVINERKPEKVRAFMSLTTDRKRGGGYRVTADILSDVEHRKQLLADAYRVMRSFMQKYGILQELSGVIDSMDQALENDAG